MKRPFIATSFMALLLSACGGSDEAMLDRPGSSPTIQQEPTLSASPLAVEMDVYTSKTIDVKSAISATEIDHWALTDVVHRSTALGVVDNIQTSKFDFEATDEGIAVLDYTVEGGSHTKSANVLIAIKNENINNNAPNAEYVVKDTKSDTSIEIDLNSSISDIDNDTLTIEHVNSPSQRFIHDGSGIVTFTPAGFIGTDTAAYSVSDGRGGYDVAYITVNSKDANPTKPNNAPTAGDFVTTFNADTQPTWVINLDTAVQADGQPLIADEDNDTLMVDRVFAGSGRVTQSNNILTYTPADKFSGIDQFTYVITDGKGGFAAGTITATVSRTPLPTNPNNPTANPLTVTGIMDNATSSTEIDVSGEVGDKDGDTVTLFMVTGSNGIAVKSTKNALAFDYTPPSPAVGLKDTVTYVVTDGMGGYAMSSVTIDLTPNNPTAPTSTLASLSTLHDVPLTGINLNDYISDRETANSELTITNLSSATSPATAILGADGKNLTYTPNGFIGTDVLTYNVTDDGVPPLSTTGTLVVVVNGDDNANIVAGDITLAVNIDLDSEGTGARTLDWKSNVSSDDDPNVTYTLVNAVGATLGATSTAGNILTYTPSTSTGTDKFVYTVKSNHSPEQYAQGEVTVTLGLPDAPEISELSITLDNGTLNSNVTCATCETNRYQYAWIVNGLTVGASASLPYKAEYDGFNIRLTVKGADQYGQTTAEQYVVVEKVGISDVYATDYAFAALRTDSTVITWGSNISGGNSSEVQSQLTDVKTVFNNGNAFAALKNDGTVVTWGEANSGGDSSAVQSQLTDVKTVYSTDEAFAALKNDGTVVTWGDLAKGGDSGAVQSQLTDVKTIYSTEKAFAALKNDGTIVAWGDSTRGGDSSAVQSQLNDIKMIYSNDYAFVALRNDDTIVSWGHFALGGNSSLVQAQLTDVKSVYSTGYAFAALKNNGTVVSWGATQSGGNSSLVQSQLTDIKMIYNTDFAFAALKNDNTVVTWGSDSSGGDSSAVQSQLTDVNAVYSNPWSFAALKNDGRIVTWGDQTNGGDSSSVQSQLIDVKAVYTNNRAFAVLKNDGSIVTWGDQTNGGDSSSVQPHLNDVKSILGGESNSFAALRGDGSVIAWGSNAKQIYPSALLVESSLP